MSMDNPQHYQPLSHALNPPVAGPSQPQSNYTSYPKQPDEEDDEDDDEGTVEDQLKDGDPARSLSPKQDSDQKSAQSPPQQDSEQKRRPGRPRGSKNRRPRVSMSATQPTQKQTLAPEVNTQNQQYYEFQWRVLNLCAEFYGAAEELVKATQPLVIAQCYSMGPGNKVDPLVMLNEAKRICDTLLANPTQLINSPPPPPPIYPSVYQPPAAQMPPPPAPSGSKPPSASSPPATVITQPQSFVVPMGAQYPVYHPPGAYPTTTPYYQYGYAPPFYPAPMVHPHPHPPMEDNPRNLKDASTSRGVKRPRESEDSPESPVRPNSAAPVAQNSTSSPHSQHASTPIASPSLQNQTRLPPPPAAAAPAQTASSLPWPMPTVAVNTPSPVIAAPSTQDHRVTSYYRPRPSDPSSKPPVGHTYINYQPNGTRLSQNGK